LSDDKTALADQLEPEPSWRGAWPPYSYWARVGLTFVALAAGVALLWSLRGILLVLIASLVLAIGLQPSIRWFERRGLKRSLGLAAVLIGGLLVFGGLALALVPFLSGQIADLVDGFPEYFEEFTQSAPSFVVRLAEWTGIDNLTSSGGAGAGDGTEAGIDPLKLIADLGGTVFSILTLLIVTPYFAFEIPAMRSWAVRLLRPRHREDFMRVLSESTDLIANYIVGNLVVSMIAGLVAFAGFQLLDIRFALALAAWVAFTDLIPAVGATIGAVGVAAVVALQGGDQLIAAMILLFVYQMVENYLISPRVMKRAVDLNPATVIVALMVGGSLAGLVGALLALPVAAMIKVVVFQLLVPERLEFVRTEAARDMYQGKKRGRVKKLP
jgi:predicted PurR-regulated permease PerM